MKKEKINNPPLASLVNLACRETQIGIGYRIYRKRQDKRENKSDVEPENFSFFLTAVNIYGEESAPSEKTDYKVRYS